MNNDLSKGARAMAATTGRTVMVSLVLVVAIVAALVFGLSYMQRERAVETKTVETKTRVETKAEPKVEPKVEPKAEAKPEVKAEAKVESGSEVKPATPAMPAVSPPASPLQADSSSATAKAETKAGTAPVEPPRPSNTDKPSFDITRVERSGDAVIAGRAAPGATVELLRDGESLGRAVADQSGQFVMTPPPLPPGNYSLTLRSRSPDGQQATSEQKMAVALDAAQSSSPVASPRAEAPRPAWKLRRRTALRRKLANLLKCAFRPRNARRPPWSSPAATASGASAAPPTARGSYTLLLKANRGQIRDPDLIYPGQSFILPRRAR
jgi:nucleoid-associated protein YgaU